MAQPDMRAKWRTATTNQEGLITEILTNKHHGMPTARRIAQEMDVVANALRRVAVVADAIHLTGCLDVETGSIDGRSR